MPVFPRVFTRVRVIIDDFGIKADDASLQECENPDGSRHSRIPLSRVSLRARLARFNLNEKSMDAQKLNGGGTPAPIPDPADPRDLIARPNERQTSGT